MRRRCQADQILLERARKHYEAWLDADLALATSKSYTIDGRTLTRANAAEIQQKIAFWRNELCRLESGRSSVNRIQRVMPRDL